jgi:hypothetical protein
MSIAGNVVSLDAVTAYPVDPQVSLSFHANRTYIFSSNPQAIIYVSLDGVNDHLSMDGSKNNYAELRSPAAKVWLRREAGTVSPTSVAVRITSEFVQN